MPTGIVGASRSKQGYATRTGQVEAPKERVRERARDRRSTEAGGGREERSTPAGHGDHYWLPPSCTMQKLSLGMATTPVHGAFTGGEGDTAVGLAGVLAAFGSGLEKQVVVAVVPSTFKPSTVTVTFWGQRATRRVPPTNMHVQGVAPHRPQTGSHVGNTCSGCTGDRR